MALRSSRKSRRKTFRKRRPSRKARRVVRRRRTRGSDVHHFKETVNCGTIACLPSSGTSQTNSTGAFIFRLTDLPAYQTLGQNFEFARVNKFRMEFWPKANMQLIQAAASGSAETTFSPSGTFITAVDQVPIYGPAIGGVFVQAATWSNDASNSSGVTSGSAVQTAITTNYIRGIEGSRETELYKKHVISFYPAFYDYVMTGTGTGAISNVSNTIGTFGSNGCAERKIKKWISISNINSQATPSIATNVGPLYFGPVYAIDNNVATTNTIPLYDVRLTYSVSFKRLKGVV